jgi:hypothetical protein
MLPGGGCGKYFTNIRFGTHYYDEPDINLTILYDRNFKIDINLGLPGG